MGDSKSDVRHDSGTQVQIQIGGQLPLGMVALVIKNCPLLIMPSDDGEHESAHPAFKLTARQSMEMGMNLIHFAKVAEQQAVAARRMAETEAERCTTLTDRGQCVLVREHHGNHATIEGD